MVWGCKRYVSNVCMYVALLRLYSGIITQTARRRESGPISEKKLNDIKEARSRKTSPFASSQQLTIDHRGTQGGNC